MIARPRPSRCANVLVLLWALPTSLAVATEEAPARPGIDAPELAALGPYAVGFASREIVQPDQRDPLHGEPSPAAMDRHLPLRIWYPAKPGGSPVTYRAALPGPDAAPAAFTIPGIAVAGAEALAGSFPLVLLAHGGSNVPEVMAWLGENLASKGYVVVAPDFGDPPITERAKFIFPITRRPLDLAFVAREAARLAQARVAPFEGADPGHTALIGYSMGGYGVLAAAGAALDPGLAAASRGILGPFVAGGSDAASLRIPNLCAVVAIAPPRRLGPLTLWSPDGLAEIRAPTLLIVGSQDHLVGYDPGVRTLFNEAHHAQRYLLTFREAGHNIAMSGSPTQMQARLWDKDWFEDPVWRKPRLMAVEAHFITAFFDRYARGDESRAAYLDGLVPDSNDGGWPDATRPYGAISPGAPAATLWKGFQAAHATGMSFESRPPDR